MEYANNRCDPSTRVPAMDELCRQWQQCLYRPMWIGTYVFLFYFFILIKNNLQKKKIITLTI